ncbi:MAG: hypothetical protein ACK2TW_04950 [Anaerolineales bacterium]|jgi:hypothetical protein
MSNPAANPRKRAWFFLQIAEGHSPHEIASNLYEQYKDQPEGDLDRYVVIRACLISGFERFRIVVPVDAIVLPDKPEEFVLDEVEALFKDIEGVNCIFRIVVEEQIPEIPHFTQAYITEAEFEAGRELDIIDVAHSGRQYPQSPGSNKWG